MRSFFIYSTNKVSKIIKCPEIVERRREFDKLEGNYLHYPNFYTMNFHATEDLECRVPTQSPQSRMVKGILATQQYFFRRMALVSQPPQLKQFTSPFTVIVKPTVGGNKTPGQTSFHSWALPARFTGSVGKKSFTKPFKWLPCTLV